MSISNEEYTAVHELVDRMIDAISDDTPLVIHNRETIDNLMLLVIGHTLRTAMSTQIVDDAIRLNDEIRKRLLDKQNSSATM